MLTSDSSLLAEPENIEMREELEFNVNCEKTVFKLQRNIFCRINVSIHGFIRNDLMEFET